MSNNNNKNKRNLVKWDHKRTTCPCGNKLNNIHTHTMKIKEEWNENNSFKNEMRRKVKKNI